MAKAKSRVTRSTGSGLTVIAHQGDAKTLLAFDLPQPQTARLAGFTIQCRPKGQSAFPLFNLLTFADPTAHAQVEGEDPAASVNAPFQKFRWLHVPGTNHQGVKPVWGTYTYTVTPRYFDENGSMLKLDAKLSKSVSVPVGPFKKQGVSVGFTRGYTQSQGFVRHFGKNAKVVPKGKDPFFDTSKIAGTGTEGKKYTFAEAYEWLGLTARQHIFDVLDAVVKDKTLLLDMFAYDLTEPDVAARLLTLAKQGRLRLVLDDSKTHQAGSAELKFAAQFKKVAQDATTLQRGHFSSLAHDKILIVKKSGGAKASKPVKVLTGSTNFSVTGMYVNSNHVLVFEDPAVVIKYGELFETVWENGALTKPFITTDLSLNGASFSSKLTPKIQITFAPHNAALAKAGLDSISQRVLAEKKSKGAVFFAVMDLDANVGGSVVSTLRGIHKDSNVFSFGITDSTNGTELYAPGKSTGVFVTGKPGKSSLPAPFDQVPGVAGHQVHHKFVVCGFGGKAPIVYCGSSNLALGGESKNGDNLLSIEDADIARVFVIEAVALVDHFQFLRNHSAAIKKPKAKPPTDKRKAALAAGISLATNSDWVKPYYTKGDLKLRDRELFGR